MPRDLPPMSTLRAFDAVVRLGSVTRAAEQLGRTHGALSRQLRTLQEHAGLPLFEKAGTGLKLTRAGEAFHRVVAEALDALERGYRRLRDDARGPNVHVACSATFAMRWLVPHLPGFYRRHPGVQVRLSMTSVREHRDDGADLILTWDRLSGPIWGEVRALRLADVAFGLVCAPGYPVAVDGPRCRVAARIVHEQQAHAWDAWQAATGRRLTWDAELSFPHTHLCIEGALSGLGATLVERRLVRDDLAGGRLVAPCGFVGFAGGFAAVPAGDRPPSRAVLDFVAWLRDTIAMDEEAAATGR